jgi:hypothetical protein
MIEVNWLLFVAASLVLIVTPGQDMILVMSRSIAQGAVAGVATATGVCSGLIVHTVVAALGLGALIRTSEWLYLGLQLAGAVYLGTLGLQLLRAPQRQLAIAGSALKRPARMFLDGALSNICNPKIAVFYLASCPSSWRRALSMRPCRCSSSAWPSPCSRCSSRGRSGSAPRRSPAGCGRIRSRWSGCSAPAVSCSWASACNWRCSGRCDIAIAGAESEASLEIGERSRKSGPSLTVLWMARAVASACWWTQMNVVWVDRKRAACAALEAPGACAAMRAAPASVSQWLSTRTFVAPICAAEPSKKFTRPM